MVCVYCGKATKVTNSRHQTRLNNIWRRRYCPQCRALFSTAEQPDLSTTFMVQGSRNMPPSPMQRDKLFLSIYESCKHRPNGLTEASALTETIVAKLIVETDQVLIMRDDIVVTAKEVLNHFDQSAAAIYAAYYPTTRRKNT